MAIFGFGTRNKPRGYNYMPRFYDPEREEREARKREIIGENYQEGEYEPGLLIREQRLRRMRTPDKNHSKSKAVLIRTVIFFVLLLAILYLMSDIFLSVPKK